ncbi:hypothetical protein ASPZODRAFT_59839 [Penicilliopsis zonata CBS 506.65]|uniref:Aminotransferase class I/classII large domain-containing protein n=1 Tax=Penicilliopsis zonata CBS 506.65 TaxID=1073090 RepID=A0A1L9SNY2_9EURO|nr:hypothetical protein ASPZODRAFT_59839 [Penicilliopsis zonata CBS 506.65]OJJ48962.1 hypothetical protein ASPZODRAFT_59839 [Penicilliopsis zonata CBS 506.65]
MENSAPLPQPLDLSHHFSYVTKLRQASEVKDLYKYFKANTANLAGGLPHVSYFPFDTLEAGVALPQRLASHQEQTSTRVTVPKESDTVNVKEKIDLSTALQYGTAEGYPPLYTFLRRFVREHLHPNVPYADGPEITLSCGSTDGFSKVIEAFVNPWNPNRDWIRDREGILCEKFTYMSPFQLAKPKGLNIVGVPMDHEGMLPSGLEDVLENWDFRQGRRPHLMYTVTMGQNPTGGTLSLERRRAIYALCQKYDVLIIEDDPYWNLQYGPSNVNYNAEGVSSGYAFLDSLVPSYLAVDTEGRVIRLDTFSKTIAPGCRLGWITAQPAVIERLVRITEVSTQQPSGFVQSLVAELLIGQSRSQSHSTSARASKTAVEQAWHVDGWVRWLEGLRDGYHQRMQAMCGALEKGKYLISENHESSGHESTTTAADDEDVAWNLVTKTQMYDFHAPTAGMFVWVELCLSTHPLAGQVELPKLSRALWFHLTRAPFACLVAPGELFAPSAWAQADSWRFVRLCFAPMAFEDVEALTRRFVDGCAAFWQKKDPSEVEDDIKLA